MITTEEARINKIIVVPLNTQCLQNSAESEQMSVLRLGSLYLLIKEFMLRRLSKRIS